jgi:hypothetical protein
MTLDELRKQLDALDMPGGTPVILSKDAEGNGFSPAVEAEVAMYAAETTWSGERYMAEADRQATGIPDEYDEAPADAVRAVFLWPTN